MVLVGRNLVVHEGVIIPDVPQRYDNVALHPLRTLRSGRHFSLSDAIGPVREHFQRGIVAHGVQCRIHGIAPNAAVEPAIPGIERRLDVRLHFVHIIERARQPVPELMTEIAAGFQRVDPVILREHAGAHTIALSARARKEIRRRRLHE